MNAIWGGMLLTGIVYGILTGRADVVAEAVLSSAKEGVSLCVTMFGVMALWSGLMEIAKEAGLIRAVTGRLRPVMRFLFPRIPKDHPALEHIAANCAANVLGLGSASTVYGLKAMEELEELEEERRKEEQAAGSIVPRGTASSEMCTFLILNISSLQLIPVNIIAYRTQYGSVNPTAVVGPGIVATAVSTGVAVVFCKMMESRAGIGAA
ncbi:MAG: nucleoside recognition protein [Lachnospiraceae bacterium]|nr:nucleoside recognition protein [Lachnospiraceae bacterium]